MSPHERTAPYLAIAFQKVSFLSLWALGMNCHILVFIWSPLGLSWAGREAVCALHKWPPCGGQGAPSRKESNMELDCVCQLGQGSQFSVWSLPGPASCLSPQSTTVNRLRGTSLVTRT